MTVPCHTARSGRARTFALTAAAVVLCCLHMHCCSPPQPPQPGRHGAKQQRGHAWLIISGSIFSAQRQICNVLHRPTTAAAATAAMPFLELFPLLSPYYEPLARLSGVSSAPMLNLSGLCVACVCGVRVWCACVVCVCVVRVCACCACVCTFCSAARAFAGRFLDATRGLAAMGSAEKRCRPWFFEPWGGRNT